MKAVNFIMTSFKKENRLLFDINYIAMILSKIVTIYQIDVSNNLQNFISNSATLCPTECGQPRYHKNDIHEY